MATDKKQTRAFSVQFPPDGDPQIYIERATVRVYENGDTYALPETSLPAKRTLAELASATLPGGRVTVSTYGELLALLEACAEDLEADEVLKIEALEIEKKALVDAAAAQRSALYGSLVVPRQVSE